MKFLKQLFTQDKKPTELSKVILWICGTILVDIILEYYFDLPELNYLVVALLGVGFYLLKHNPLQKNKFPQAVEMGLATVLIGIFILHFGFEVVVPHLENDDLDNRPCGRKTYEFQCYNLSQNACRSAWSHYEEECASEGRANVSLRPTQLVGAGVKRCAQKKFYKYMSYNRKSDKADVCQSYFSALGQQ